MYANLELTKPPVLFVTEPGSINEVHAAVLVKV